MVEAVLLANKLFYKFHICFQIYIHFLENPMFVLNAYFCSELKFVAILRSKLRNTGVDSDFTQASEQKLGVGDWRKEDSDYPKDCYDY